MSWPALLLWPQFQIVGLSVDFELLKIGVYDFLPAIGALIVRVG